MKVQIGEAVWAGERLPCECFKITLNEKEIVGLVMGQHLSAKYSGPDSVMKIAMVSIDGEGRILNQLRALLKAL